MGWRLTAGSKVQAAGAFVALVGCFLPIFSGASHGVSIVPDMISRSLYVLLLPLGCVLLCMLSAFAAGSNQADRMTVGGLSIALASPLAVVSLALVAAAPQLAGMFGEPAAGTGVGAGSIVLALGSLASLVGAFLVLKESLLSRLQQ
jgi:hypothetical protein